MIVQVQTPKVPPRHALARTIFQAFQDVVARAPDKLLVIAGDVVYRAKELQYILSAARSKMAFIAQEFRKCQYPDLYHELAADLPCMRHPAAM